MSPELLVVAGESSGDRIAAAAARAARVRTWGLAGAASRRAGVELVADSQELGVLGLGDVPARLPAIARATFTLLARARRAPPAAALLVNFTELNLRLGRWLRRRRVPVLWCVAPQAWAWRPGRLRTLGGAVDRLAVILPFEEALWRAHGVDAHYVGHPSLEASAGSPGDARERLGLGSGPALAVLPGSRAGEVRRLAPALCEAAAALLASGTVREARVLAAHSLDPRSAELTRSAARSAGLPVVEANPTDGAAPLLAAFDVALCASGTACLEAALAGAAPVIAYRVDAVTSLAARWLLRTPHVGLPNILLGRRAYPELLQGEATAPRLAAAARGLLEPRARERALEDRDALRALLAAPAPGDFGARVAALLDPWLAA